MDFLSKDEILQAQDVLREEVAVPEWGGKVLVRGLTGAERDAFESTVVMSQNGRRTVRYNLANFRARLIAMTVIDPDSGARLFDDSDVLALGQKSAAALQRVFEVAQRLSGLSEQDVEDLTKNSESGPNGASGSN